MPTPSSRQRDGMLSRFWAAEAAYVETSGDPKVIRFADTHEAGEFWKRIRTSKMWIKIANDAHAITPGEYVAWESESCGAFGSLCIWSPKTWAQMDTNLWILHQLAHTLAKSRFHDGAFVGYYLKLVRRFLGEDTARTLKAHLIKNKIRTRAVSQGTRDKQRDNLMLRNMRSNLEKIEKMTREDDSHADIEWR